MSELGTCQNCDGLLSSEQNILGKLFCSEKCQQIAKAIRYGRAAISDGKFDHPDVHEALMIKISHAIGGGYPQNERRLPESLRQFIFERDNHLCQICKNAPATEIDHISGSDDDPSNLQAVCGPCNRSKFWEHTRPATPEEQAEFIAIMRRIKSDHPMRICDDDEQWSHIWRELSREQKRKAR